MIDATWVSQAFPPEGASAAEGIRNQLGRPELDLLTILIRESAQNSWDARLGDRPVDYRIDLKSVGPAHAPAWRDLFLRNVPSIDQLPLRKSLSAPSIRVLAISDRGTTGLGGPTRADNAVVENHDFVSFIRNIGEPRDTELGGGTYGFGKGVFYLISRSGTVLVHTRCRVEGELETRLMGCALWKSYAVGDGMAGRRYTGRHWWGEPSADNVIEPLVGPAADLVAERLGLQPFEPKETGTTVVVIDPDLDERSPAETSTYLADTILWNLWPKMLNGTAKSEPPMRFSVYCDGMNVPIPDPRGTSPIDLFVAAYESMNSTDLQQELWCQRPKEKLGLLGLEKRFMTPFEPTSAGRASGIESTVHHVCLMRTAELVVTYHAGPKPPAEHVSYAGVFRVTQELDSVYAESEPPTHDAWRWHSLEGRAKTFVRVTFQRIKESLEALIDIEGRVRTSSSEIPLGAASRAFSSLVAGAWGTGGATDFGRSANAPTRPSNAPDANTAPTVHSGDLFDATSPKVADADDDQTAPWQETAPESRRSVSARKPWVEYIDVPYFDVRSGKVVLVQAFRITTFGIHRLRADLAVTLPGAGGRETDPPRNAAKPEFFAWEDSVGTLHRNPSKTIEGSDDIWRVLVQPAPDTMTEITVTATPEGSTR